MVILRIQVSVLFLLGAIMLYGQRLSAQDSIPPADSSRVTLRNFNPETIARFKDKVSYDDAPQPRSYTWWMEIRDEILRFFFGGSKEGRLFWKIIGYALAIFSLLAIIFGLLRLRTGSLFSRSSRALNIGSEEAAGDIHQLDFEQLLNEALKSGDFRRAVRLLYLESLKLLSSHGLIDWRINKTNQDYQYELAGNKLQPPFARLTRQYEYVWYGDFPIDSNRYREMEGTFRQFQQQVKNRS